MNLMYDVYEGKGASALTYEAATTSDAETMHEKLLEDGFSLTEENLLGGNTFSFYKKENLNKIIAFYPNAKIIKQITDESPLIQGLSDRTGEKICPPLLSMVDTFDFGLAFVLRLEDGRFIVFDGGWEERDYAERLMALLKKQCVTEKITIAAWIMTHPHIDHYRCYISFAKKFENQYVLQRFIYNFFDADTKNDTIEGAEKEGAHMARFFECVEKIGAPVYRAHTGEVFDIEGAHFEVLSSPDDTLKPKTTNINTLSLVFKITYMGQTILMTGDAMLPSSKLADRFGAYLKSDILQVPHHMFDGGCVSCYRLIDPETILIPCEDEYVFSVFSTRANHTKEPNLFLLRDMNVKDCYTGARGNIVLPLPHKARANGKELLLADLEQGDRSLGAKDWYFADITTENCTFTLVNTSWEAAKLRIDIISEVGGGPSVHDFKELTVPRIRYRVINLNDEEGYEPEARGGEISKYFKEGEKYVLRFRCYTPLIVKGPNEPIYHS